MGLLDRFRPQWRHSDPDVRVAAIASIDDPATLTEIAIRDPEWFVRHEAFAALRAMVPDESHYARLLRSCQDEEIRRKAVKVVTDEEELRRVAAEDQYRYVRDAAQHRLEEIQSGVWAKPPS